MKEITEKIKAQSAEKYIPFAEMLRSEGKDDDDILYFFRKYFQQCKRNFFNKTSDFTHIRKIIPSVVKADSKIETRLLLLLDQQKIPFVFQYKIGPYRVDFLIKNFLVIELDGPQHSTEKAKEYDTKRDNYLKKMGYKILRIPVWLLELNHEGILKEIKTLIGQITHGKQ